MCMDDCCLGDMSIDDYCLYGYLFMFMDKYNLRVTSVDDYCLYGSFLMLFKWHKNGWLGKCG